MSRRFWNRQFFVVWTALLFLVSGYLVGNASAAGLTKIADNVYAYVDTKKSSPQNSFGANAGIIIGAKGIVVVDTLISAKEGQRLLGDIRAVSGLPLQYVVNTHGHLDHVFGNSEFEKKGAVIISHVNPNVA